MTKQEVIDTYIALDSGLKVLFLSITAYSLTVSMRGLYDQTQEPIRVIECFKGANEIQHHLSAELRHQYQKDEKRYPDDVLINILIETAANYGIQGELGYSLRQAMRSYYRGNNPHSTT